MLSFAAISLEVLRPLKTRLRWSMQCLVSFADRDGVCWPSLRRFADHAGISRSAAQRDLAELEREGAFTRKRAPGGRYRYQIAERFLPHWPRRDSGVPAAGTGVPQRGTQQRNPKKKVFLTSEERPRVEAVPPPINWEPRLRSWRKDRFWLPYWGPKPNEAGCWAPDCG